MDFYLAETLKQLGKGTHKLFHAFLTITILISYRAAVSGTALAKLQLAVVPNQ